MPTTGDTSPTSGRTNAPLVRVYVGILSDRLVGILNAGQHPRPRSPNCINQIAQ